MEAGTNQHLGANPNTRLVHRPRSRARLASNSRSIEEDEMRGDLAMIAWAILFALAAFFIVFSEAAKALNCL
jgi:hypothetical protein